MMDNYDSFLSAHIVGITLSVLYFFIFMDTLSFKKFQPFEKKIMAPNAFKNPCVCFLQPVSFGRTHLRNDVCDKKKGQKMFIILFFSIM